MTCMGRLMAGVALGVLGLPAMAADMVIVGGRVMTMVDGAAKADAIAITDDRIVAVGAIADLLDEITPETVLYELPGALILPGFQDAHIHLAWSGAELEDISLWEAESTDDLAAAITEGAALTPDEAWVRGTGWDLSAFPDQTLTAAFLDTLVPDRPAYFAAADGHSAWVNSKALELAGITADTKDPEGGRIERGADGAPQGILRESAVALVGDLVPPYSPEQVARGLAAAQAEANSYGITSIIDAKAEDWMLEGYKAALDAGLLTLRVRAAVEVTSVDGDKGLARALAARDQYADDMLAVNAVKVYADGVIESKTAAMLEPYEGDTSAGELLIDAPQMAAICQCGGCGGDAGACPRHRRRRDPRSARRDRGRAHRQRPL